MTIRELEETMKNHIGGDLEVDTKTLEEARWAMIAMRKLAPENRDTWFIYRSEQGNVRLKLKGAKDGF